MIKRLLPPIVKRAINSVRLRRHHQMLDCHNRFLNVVAKGEVQIDLPGINGKFWIDVRSHLLRQIVVSTHGTYEPHITAIINSHLQDGLDFVDVGSNVGFFSIHAALSDNWKGRVLAVDPNPKAFELLQRNIQDNQIVDRVIPLHVAASDCVGVLKLTVVEGREEYSTVTDSVHPAVQHERVEQIAVKAMAMDSAIDEYQLQPGLIKIDAEGAEADVLNGLHNTIDRFAPVIICEMGADTYGSNTESVARIFKNHGYSILSDDGRPFDQRHPAKNVVAMPQQTKRVAPRPTLKLHAESRQETVNS